MTGFEKWSFDVRGELTFDQFRAGSAVVGIAFLPEAFFHLFDCYQISRRTSNSKETSILDFVLILRFLNAVVMIFVASAIMT